MAQLRQFHALASASGEAITDLGTGFDFDDGLGLSVSGEIYIPAVGVSSVDAWIGLTDAACDGIGPGPATSATRP